MISPTVAIIRICFIVVAYVFFVIFLHRIAKQPLKGYAWITIGVFLIGADMIVGTLFHGNLIPQPIIDAYLPVIGMVMGYVGKMVGVSLFVFGGYLLVRSIQANQEPQYANLIENSLVGIYLVQDGVYKFVNPKFAEIGGYTREEIIGKPVLDLVTPADREVVARNIEKRLSGAIDAIHYEVTALKKNGEEVAVEVYGSVINYMGKPAIHGTLIDITDRKNFEQQLSASEGRYSALAKSSNDIICETTVTGQFVYVSDNIVEILGFDADELLQQNLFFLVHPNDYMTVYSEFDRSIEKLDSGRFTFRSRLKSGGWKWFESTCQPYVSGSEEVRMVIVSRDISLRRTMEDEIFKASKLESIGLLAGGIAHDFNNILTVILGNVSLARSFSAGRTELASILEDTENACIKAKDLTQQFLTFSKGGEPIKKITAISDLLRETIDFSSHGSNVKCNLRIQEPLWPVDIDDGQISQVIQNLMINAEQAMPAGGIVDVWVENIILTGKEGMPLKDGDYVQISLRDHGVGIPEENIKKIFDPYFTTKEKGSGLGLTTSYSIIKNHGGLLTVSSLPGTGTTFKIFLPAATLHPIVPRKDKEPKQEVTPSSAGGRVLVMDDEDAIRTSLNRMLKHIGYDVALAECGEEACRLYERAKRAQEPFDVVLMDLTVPGGMGGKETIKKLMEMDASVKAIVSSGYSNDPIMSDYRRHGFRGVIVKPFQLEKLSRVLHQVINDSQPAAR